MTLLNSRSTPYSPSLSNISYIKETCPSFRHGNINAISDVNLLQNLLEPHVKSFDYFLEHGLPSGINDIVPLELDVADPTSSKSKIKTNLPDEATDNFVGINDNEFQQQKILTEKSKYIRDVEIISLWFENVCISSPSKTENNVKHIGPQFPSPFTREKIKSPLIPRECRERHIMYAGEMTGDVCIQINHRRIANNHSNMKGVNKVVEMKGPVRRLKKRFGEFPIMVMSQACHLRDKKPSELVSMREEQNEFGGYFIVNGIERCIRILQIPRRNHPTAIRRSTFKKRGPTYTDIGVSIRCARYTDDQSSITNTVHYLTTGGASLRFVARKQEFLIPVVLILRALSGSNSSDIIGGVTDKELYCRIVREDNTNTFLSTRAELFLQDARRFIDLHSPIKCLAYLGSRFRAISDRADSTSNVDIGHFILKRYILVHLRSRGDKLECLLLLLRKLYTFAAGECDVDNTDSLQNQELLLPGHIISNFVKEKFEEMIQSIRIGFMKEMRLDCAKFIASMSDINYLNRKIERYAMLSSGGIGKKVIHFLSTGNIISTTGLDLMQSSGYTIMAERINFLRYCSHFRSVHRGQFFMDMKTTAIRKLLPDQWGFLCPVHTPDGGPCGLLSHLAIKCSVMTHSATLIDGRFVDLDELLISLGITPSGMGRESVDSRSSLPYYQLPVCLDGRVVGGAPVNLCQAIASRLRTLKVQDNTLVPLTLEIVMISPGVSSGAYPGLFLFTEAGRLIRPVLNISAGKMEMIGPMEQPFLDIACLPEDVREGITTHQEIDPTNILSLIASLTPFSDYNQSPRNMYQCQMAKQTMGTPFHSFPHRPDNRIYRLQNPQAPIAQTTQHGEYKMDEYPNGTNAIVAVLSYTGFDMEDAMIINKSSYEFGFAHGSVYKTMIVDLDDDSVRMDSYNKSNRAIMRFSNKLIKASSSITPTPGKEEMSDNINKFKYPNLDMDGLPVIGSWVKEGDPIYSIVNEITGDDKIGRHKEKEPACIESVRLIGYDETAGKSKVSITQRIPRNPVIGDKFSSRHGQKGILSILWPHVDMPFSESGISPDIIINPHAFPSRMTIGMLIESLAGKSGAVHGLFQDSTPFTFHESGDQVAIDYFGEQLQAAGYSYYGSEPLYSGVSGCLMHADLYIGVVFYQRLRHMVSDKYQVRETGHVNCLTRQPIKGRKKGGGIRLGEMERDSLLSHGSAYLLHDRLLNCSDKHVAYVCRRCGDLLFPATERSAGLCTKQNMNGGKSQLRLFCRNLKCIESTSRKGSSDEMVEPIVLPYVYRYLVNELAGMNIRMVMNIN